jgi:hypothetical protein
VSHESKNAQPLLERNALKFMSSCINVSEMKFRGAGQISQLVNGVRKLVPRLCEHRPWNDHSNPRFSFWVQICGRVSKPRGAGIIDKDPVDIPFALLIYKILVPIGSRHPSFHDPLFEIRKRRYHAICNRAIPKPLRAIVTSSRAGATRF